MTFIIPYFQPGTGDLYHEYVAKMDRNWQTQEISLTLFSKVIHRPHKAINITSHWPILVNLLIMMLSRHLYLQVSRGILWVIVSWIYLMPWAAGEGIISVEVNTTIPRTVYLNILFLSYPPFTKVYAQLLLHFTT